MTVIYGSTVRFKVDANPGFMYVKLYKAPDRFLSTVRRIPIDWNEKTWTVLVQKERRTYLDTSDRILYVNPDLRTDYSCSMYEKYNEDTLVGLVRELNKCMELDKIPRGPLTFNIALENGIVKINVKSMPKRLRRKYMVNFWFKEEKWTFETTSRFTTRPDFERRKFYLNKNGWPGKVRGDLAEATDVFMLSSIVIKTLAHVE